MTDITADQLSWRWASQQKPSVYSSSNFSRQTPAEVLLQRWWLGMHTCAHVYTYATHTCTKINLLIVLTAYIYICFCIFFSFSHARREKTKTLVIWIFFLSVNRGTMQHINAELLEPSWVMHIHTHPHIMEICKVILYTYVPICTIRTAVCNFINRVDGRRKNTIRRITKSQKNSTTLSHHLLSRLCERSQ